MIQLSWKLSNVKIYIYCIFDLSNMLSITSDVGSFRLVTNKDFNSEQVQCNKL